MMNRYLFSEIKSHSMKENFSNVEKIWHGIETKVPPIPHKDFTQECQSILHWLHKDFLPCFFITFHLQGIENRWFEQRRDK